MLGHWLTHDHQEKQTDNQKQPLDQVESYKYIYRKVWWSLIIIIKGNYRNFRN